MPSSSCAGSRWLLEVKGSGEPTTETTTKTIIHGLKHDIHSCSTRRKEHVIPYACCNVK